MSNQTIEIRQRLFGWFVPTIAFSAFGRAWVSDGCAAVAVDVAPAGLGPPPCDGEATLRRGLPAEHEPAATPTAAPGGRARLDGVSFGAHYLTLCEAAHPGLVWRLGERQTDRGAVLTTASGFVGEDLVAQVMCRRESTRDASDDISPRCPTCEGAGRRQVCPTCRGSGECQCATCECHHDCGTCGAMGRVEQCASCGATGRWMAGGGS
jgi:hypothetical protein